MTQVCHQARRWHADSSKPGHDQYQWEGSKMNSLRETRLSKREIQVLRLVAEGLPNKLIATEMWVTEQTVKFHMNNVLRKLSLTNRTEAARWAIGQGLA
jgi:DNA-binding NarL/FixJ family response regulator